MRSMNRIWDMCSMWSIRSSFLEPIQPCRRQMADEEKRVQRFSRNSRLSLGHKVGRTDDQSIGTVGQCVGPTETSSYWPFTLWPFPRAWVRGVLKHVAFPRATSSLIPLDAQSSTTFLSVEMKGYSTFRFICIFLVKNLRNFHPFSFHLIFQMNPSTKSLRV